MKSISAGYLVLNNFATPEEVHALRERAGQLVEEFIPPPTSRSVFSTKSQVNPPFQSIRSDSLSFGRST